MPVITVTLTTAGTVYAASIPNLMVSAVAIQPFSTNTDVVYFNDSEDPSSSTPSGMQFGIPASAAAGYQMPIFAYGGDNNPINLAQLRFVSATNAQKMTVFYKQT